MLRIVKPSGSPEAHAGNAFSFPEVKQFA
jgi:hypothetical protein